MLFCKKSQIRLIISHFKIKSYYFYRICIYFFLYTKYVIIIKKDLPFDRSEYYFIESMNSFIERSAASNLFLNSAADILIAPLPRIIICSMPSDVATLTR